LHGDYKRTLITFEMAGVIDKDQHWALCDGTLIQTGDVLDRGPYGKQIHELIEKLKKEASLQNGLVVALLGNHELMNLYHDFSNISKDEIARFGGIENWKNDFLTPEYVKYLKSLPMVFLHEKTIFVHGGIAPSYASFFDNIGEINEKVSELLADENTTPETMRKIGIFTTEDSPTWYRGIIF